MAILQRKIDFQKVLEVYKSQRLILEDTDNLHEYLVRLQAIRDAEVEVIEAAASAITAIKSRLHDFADIEESHPSEMDKSLQRSSRCAQRSSSVGVPATLGANHNLKKGGEIDGK